MTADTHHPYVEVICIECACKFHTDRGEMKCPDCK